MNVPLTDVDETKAAADWDIDNQDQGGKQCSQTRIVPFKYVP